MSDDSGNGRVTVSRETLRAELLELELRLVERLTSEIARKADYEDMRSLRHRVQTLEAQKPLGDRLMQEFLDTVKEVNVVKEEVNSLKVWKGRAIGAITALAAFASVTGVKVWVGFH